MKNITTQPAAVQSLNDIQKLVSNLNTSLLKLKEDKDEYQSRINECKGLCHKIRELMDATTARIIDTGESQLSHKANR